MARAMPTISAAVSPLTRRALRKAAVWASPVRPPMISSSTSRASCSVRSRPAVSSASAALSTSFGIAGLLGRGARRRRRAAAPLSRPVMRRNVASRSSPTSVSTLSGWNCTPCTGSSRCPTPITMPSSFHAVSARQSGSASSTTSEW